MAKNDGFSRDTHKKYEGKRRDMGDGAGKRDRSSGGRREAGASYSGDDSLNKGGGGTTFGGRSPFGNGKAPEVNLNMGGNRRTAKAALGGDGNVGATFCGHGPFTRS